MPKTKGDTMNQAGIKQPDNIQLARALIRAGIAETLILKAASISEYQFRKLRKELGIIS
jgi:hypothetical protein